MKIGLVSDTHFGHPNEVVLPQWVEAAFTGVDMIVHAGDVETQAAVSAFSRLAPVYVVRGNCDYCLQNNPQAMNIEIGCGILTVAHRAGHARAAIEPRTRVMVYGHTHISLINQEGMLMVINPGSPTMPRGGLPPSVAVLTVDGNKISAELRHP